jgi:hypothetical protein
MTIHTVPTEALNASIVEIKLNSAVMFGMQYNLECYSVRNLTDEEGKPVTATGLIHTELLQVTGPKWRDWTPDAAASDEAYLQQLALTQLNLEAAQVEEAAPTE